MNRSKRRAAIASGRDTPGAATVAIPELLAVANSAYQERRLADAEIICKQILSRAPSHATCLNLLGVVYQASARHRLAIKLFIKAIAVDDLDAGFHYNIACSYQATGQPIAAAEHFKTAITPLKPIILKLLGACTFSQSRRPEDLSSIEGRVFAWPAWLQIVYQT